MVSRKNWAKEHPHLMLCGNGFALLCFLFAVFFYAHQKNVYARKTYFIARRYFSCWSIFLVGIFAGVFFLQFNYIHADDSKWNNLNFFLRIDYNATKMKTISYAIYEFSKCDFISGFFRSFKLCKQNPSICKYEIKNKSDILVNVTT